MGGPVIYRDENGEFVCVYSTADAEHRAMMMARPPAPPRQLTAEEEAEIDATIPSFLARLAQ